MAHLATQKKVQQFITIKMRERKREMQKKVLLWSFRIGTERRFSVV